MQRKKLLIIGITSAFILIIAAIAASLMLHHNKGSSLLSELNGQDTAGSTGRSSSRTTTLTFYFPGARPAVTTEILDYVNKAVGSSLNLQVDFQFIANDPEVFTGFVKSKIKAGQPCDGICYSENLKVTLQSLAKDGTIKDISALFPKYAPKYYNKFSKEELAAASVDGKLYAVPNRHPATDTPCIIARKDLIEKYQLPGISNFDDFEAFLKMVKAKDSKIFPTYFCNSLIQLFASTGGYAVLDKPHSLVYKLNDPNMKVLPWEGTPEFKKGAETIAKFAMEGLLNYQAEKPSMGDYYTDVDAPLSDEVVTSGKWASFITTLDKAYEYNALLAAQGIDWRYNIYPLYTNNSLIRSSTLGDAILINSKSPNAEKVLQFIDWLQADEAAYGTLMYGVEGKHYSRQNGKVTPTGAGLSPGTWNWHWPFYNYEYETGNWQDESAMKEYRDIVGSKIKNPPHMGFVPSYDFDRNVGAQREASMNSKIMEWVLYFRGKKMTTEDADKEVSEYLAQINEWDYKDMYSKIQGQLDAWRKNN